MSTATKSRKKKAKSQKASPAILTDETPIVRRYLVLDAYYKFMDMPSHPLAIPTGWARQIDGDFSIDDCEFMDRENAFHHAAAWNHLEMENHADDFTDLRSCEMRWHLVFEVGPTEPSSHINVEGGCCATMSIDTTVLLQTPTAAEIAHAEKRLPLSVVQAELEAA